MGKLGTNHWRAEYTKRCTLRSEGGGWKRAMWYRAGRLPYCDDDTPHLITNVETTPATTV